MRFPVGGRRATRGPLLLGALFAGLLALAPRSDGAGETLPTGATAAEVGVVDRVGVVESTAATELRVLADPVVGELHLPTERPRPLPAVVVLHGSEGYDAGSYDDRLRGLARHLAAQGFVTLRLCYYGCAGRPSELRRVPIEDVLGAVRHLGTLPEVDAANVSVWGWSRGGELALLAGAYGPEVRSVIAVSPAPWAFNGCCSSNAFSDCAWTHGGACLPYMMRIPVERIRGPVLLMVGQYDAVWPMTYAEQVSAALDAAHHPHQLTVFPNVGHAFGTLGCIVGVDRCVPVGTTAPWDGEAHVAASRAAFLQAVRLLTSLASDRPIRLPTAQPRPTPLAAPGAPARPAPPSASPGTVLFRDDPSDPAVGRLPTTVREPDRHSRGYRDGAYVLGVVAGAAVAGSAASNVEAVVPGTYRDASIAVRVRLPNPAGDQRIALACRSADVRSEYRLAVLPASGLFQLVRWTSPSSWTLTGLQESPAIRRGAQENLLELSCHGATIEARINGQRVARVSDYTFDAGRMWVGLGQTGSGPTTPGPPTPLGTTIEAHFRDLVVTQR